MTLRKLILLVLICILALSVVNCASSSQTDKPPIDRDVAIMIATANVPSNIIGEASVYTLWNDSEWIVHFLLSGNRTVTKGEIGWPESPNNRFENHGFLPVGTYGLLTFTIDRGTGAVLSRQASDSVLLGGPGVYDTEPPQPPEGASLPLWSAIVSGIGGLVVGGIITYLIMRRKGLPDNSI